MTIFDFFMICLHVAVFVFCFLLIRGAFKE